jgi:acyl-CoA oxidase
MSQIPHWVKALKPSGPQGSELLASERSSSKIDVAQLSKVLFTKEVLERKRKILAILQSEKIFDRSQDCFNGRIDKFEVALGRAKRLAQIFTEQKWDDIDRRFANDRKW